MASPLKPLSDYAGPLQRVVKFVTADEHVRKRGVRRIVHPASKAKLFFVEAGEVVLRGILHGVVILKISLQNYLARRVATPGASRHLSEQLKRTFGGAEVGQPQSRI